VGRHHPAPKPRFEPGELAAIVLAVIGLLCMWLLLFDTPPPIPGPDDVSTSTVPTPAGS
jgi:hypothetical protein